MTPGPPRVPGPERRPWLVRRSAELPLPSEPEGSPRLPSRPRGVPSSVKYRTSVLSNQEHGRLGPGDALLHHPAQLLAQWSGSFRRNRGWSLTNALALMRLRIIAELTEASTAKRLRPVSARCERIRSRGTRAGPRTVGRRCRQPGETADPAPARTRSAPSWRVQGRPRRHAGHRSGAPPRAP